MPCLLSLSLSLYVSCCIYEARTFFCGSPLCVGDFLGRPRPFFLELLVACSFFQFFSFLGCHAAVAGAHFVRRIRGKDAVYGLRNAKARGKLWQSDRGRGSSEGSCAKKRIDFGQCAAQCASSLSPSLSYSFSLTHGAHTHTHEAQLALQFGLPGWPQLRIRAWLIH